MSTKLHEALSLILAMPYYKNDHAQTGGGKHQHEKKVAAKLKQVGFKEYKLKIEELGRKMIKEWANTGDVTKIESVLAKMPNGSYIIQPAGSQGFPDILIKDFCGRYVCMECKSIGEKQTFPMWNDNLPKHNAIYVFSSKKVNATTIFMGNDVIDVEAQILYAEHREAHIKVNEAFKSRWQKLDEKYRRGFVLADRPQVKQAGKSEKTNYFTHKDRAKCEKNALDFALQ